MPQCQPSPSSRSAVVTRQSENLSPNSISACATAIDSVDATASVISDRRMSRAASPRWLQAICMAPTSTPMTATKIAMYCVCAQIQPTVSLAGWPVGVYRPPASCT